MSDYGNDKINVYVHTFWSFPSQEWFPEDLRVKFITDYKPVVAETTIATTDIHILNSKNQLLVTLRNNPPIQWRERVQWGRQPKWFTARQSALHYLQKELNITLDDPSRLKEMNISDEFFPDSEFCDEKWNTIARHSRSSNFIIRMEDNELNTIILDDQHSKYRWVNLDDTSLHPILKETRIPYILPTLQAYELTENPALLDKISKEELIALLQNLYK